MASHCSGVRFSQSSAELSDSRILSQAVSNLSLYSVISVLTSESKLFSILVPNLVKFLLSIVNSYLLITDSPTKPLTSNSGDKISSSLSSLTSFRIGFSWLGISVEA